MYAPLALLILVLTGSAAHAPSGQVYRAAFGAATQSPIDTAAARVHSNMLRAMGGARGWEKARYFEFDFVVVRQGSEAARWRHRWDRWRGDYRLEGKRGADSIVAWLNVNDHKSGAILVNSEPATGARKDSLLTFAYARFINDSYWLIMPYKWLDEGVALTYEGLQTDEAGRHWEVVKLTFAGVGLTPQNQYLAFVNPQTSLMERWHHFPSQGAQPLIFDWKNWQKVGPIMLATEKPSLDGSSTIRFDNVRVLTSVPDRVFQK